MDRQHGALNRPVGRRGRRPALSVRGVAGYLLAAVCLVWVFHDIRPLELARSLTSINWWWVGLAVAFDILSYICQGLRWRLLLRPLGRMTTMQATRAIYVSLFANEVLPMRFGELVRAFLASRQLAASFAAVIPSMVVERLLDGVWLVFAVALAALFVRLPADILDAADVFTAAVVISIGLFVYLIYREDKASGDEAAENRAGWEPRRLLASTVHRLSSGLRGIGLSGALFASLGVSLAMLVFQALAFWLVMRAYELPISFWGGFTVFLIVQLGTAIPGAPANIGSYQFFTAAGLTLFGVDKTMAAGFSVVVFVILTVPLWIIGFFALSRSGTTLFALRDQIGDLVPQASIRRQARRE